MHRHLSFRFDGYDVDASDSFAVYIPEDCFDVGRLLGDSAVFARGSSDEGQVFVGASNCVDGVCNWTTTFAPSTTWLYLENEYPVSFYSGDVIDDVMAALAGVSVVVVGGSFVNLIVASRWPLEKSSNTQKVLKALVVVGLALTLFSTCFVSFASPSVG